MSWKRIACSFIDALIHLLSTHQASLQTQSQVIGSQKGHRKSRQVLMDIRGKLCGMYRKSELFIEH